MPFCPKCGNEVMDTDEFCSKCGTELTLHSPTNQEMVSKTEVPEHSESSDKERGRREISQSRAAVLTAVGIIFFADLLAIIFLASGGIDRPGLVLGSTFFDIFLGIFILKGKGWARTWMLVRLIVGLVVFSIVYTLANDFASVLVQIGFCVAVILLLTGTSTRFRLIGSVALFVVATLVGMIWSFMLPLMTLHEMPETPIPESFSTYTGEGFFSISYPPDWVPNMSIIEELEEEMKLYAKSLDLESQVSEMQLVFIGGKETEDWYYPLVVVQIQPRSSWPLSVMVEAESQWAEENIEQYVEYSRVSTTIGGREAIIQTYQGYNVDYILSSYTISYVVGDEFIWSVICVCDSQAFDAYRDTFDNIVRSLRVEY